MAAFVDGEMTVGEARDEGYEAEIERVTGLSLATIRNKLRDANGNTKLCNLFRQWPDRLDEIAGWTASFALERDVIREIVDFTQLGPRVVKRRLEEAHGKRVVTQVDDALANAVRVGLGNRRDSGEVIAVTEPALVDVVERRAAGAEERKFG